MKASKKNHTRLTWHSSLPGPFESGKYIFKKIQELNHISMEQLARLISKPGRCPRPVASAYTNQSDWIDFERFGMLLNVDTARLRQGFLDQLGFDSDSNNYRSIRVTQRKRQCPRCAQLDYHCVFFDLALVAECPWHRLPLDAYHFDCKCHWDSLVAHSKNVSCPICGRGGPPQNSTHPSLMDLCFERFDEATRSKILVYCSELMMWRLSVNEAQPDYKDLLVDLNMTGSINYSEGIESWQLGYALSVADRKINWKFNFPPVSVLCRTLVDKQNDTSDGQRVLIKDCYGKQYRSIRRHIYKRYVYPHRACLAKLRALNRDESLFLNGKNVCPVALAFLVWRMSIEGMVNIDGLHHNRKSNFGLRLMSPGGIRSPDFLLQWSYHAFFSLTHQLAKRCGKEKVAIEMDPFGECSGYLWSNNIIDGKCSIMRPVMESDHPCDSFVSNPVVHYYSLSNYWDWTVNSQLKHRNVMFRLYLDISERVTGTFHYINV